MCTAQAQESGRCGPPILGSDLPRQDASCSPVEPNLEFTEEFPMVNLQLSGFPPESISDFLPLIWKMQTHRETLKILQAS